MVLIIFFFLLFLFFLFPPQLHAWGGVAHFYMGLTALDWLDMVEEEVAKLIRTYPSDFLYGMMIADIIVGKKYSIWEKHSHNWNVGFSLFKYAEKKYHFSFVWGYLSHLASDVIAHNFFLPEMFIRYYHGKMKTHSYWELKFETCFDEEVWKNASKLPGKVHRDNDELLKRGLSPTLFSFSTNRRVFDIVNFQRKLKVWRNFVNTLSRRSIYKIPEDRKEFYLSRSIDAIFDLIKYGEDSSLISLDPTGSAALKRGFKIKKMLRDIKRSGIKEQEIHEIIFSHLPEIPPGIYSRRRKDERKS